MYLQLIPPFNHKATNSRFPWLYLVQKTKGCLLLAWKHFSSIWQLKTTIWVVHMNTNHIVGAAIRMFSDLSLWEWKRCSNYALFAPSPRKSEASSRILTTDWVAGEELPPKEMERLIVSTGKIPHQRTTLYEDAPMQQRLRAFSAVPLTWRRN